MKIKKILSFFAIVTVSIFSVIAFSSGFVGLKADAASVTDPSSTYSYVSQTQSLTFNVSDLSISNGSSKKFDLYGSNAITSAFSCETNRSDLVSWVGKTAVVNNSSLTYNAGSFFRPSYETFFTAGINELAYYSEDSSYSENRNMKVYSSISLSPNIVIAMSNGFVDISAESYFASFSHSSFKRVGNDYNDYITMELIAYNSITSTIKGQVLAGSLDSNPRGSYSSSKDQLLLSGDAITENDSNIIELVFSSKYNDNGSKVSDSANFLRIKEPSVSFTTSDNLAPVISCDYENLGYVLISENNFESASWTNKRVLQLKASDMFETCHGSGIQKIEYRVGDGEWQTYVDNTIELNYEEEHNVTYDITENGVYSFRVYDNVGNVSNTITYTEKHIDSNAPRATISMNADKLYLDRTFTIPVVIDQLTLGPSIDTFEYSINNGPRTPFDGNIEIINIENGTHTFAFFGFDEAGNLFEQTIEDVVVDDNVYKVTTVARNGSITESFETKRASKYIEFSAKDSNTHLYKVFMNGEELLRDDVADGRYDFYVSGDIEFEVLFREEIFLTIEDVATYDPKGYNPSYTANIDGDYEIVFKYYTVDKTQEFGAIDEVGTYTIEFSINEDLYFGFGEQIIEIVQKDIEIINVKLIGYTYTGSILSLQYDKSESFALIHTFKQNGNDVEFLDAGEYNVSIISPDSNYKIVSKIGDETEFVEGCEFVAKIDAHVIVVSNIVSTYVYNNEPQCIMFDANVSDEIKQQIVVTYSQNSNIVESPVDAGDYLAVFKFEGNTNNYIFDFATTIETAMELHISKRNVEVLAVSQQLVYGDSVSPFEYSVRNALASETLAFDVVSTNLSSNAGTYQLTFVQEETLSDEEVEIFKNYDITFVHGTVVIAKKDITVYPKQSQYKVYGEAEKTILYDVDGLIFNDSLMGELSRNEGEDVGYYTITIGTLENSNYNIFVSATEFEIIKRVCFVVVNDFTKTYGDVDPEFGFAERNTNILEKDLDMFKNPDYFVRVQGENAGKYVIAYDVALVSTLPEFGNYLIVEMDGELRINKKEISVYADEISAIYGETKTLTAQVDGLVGDDSIELVLTREIGNDVGKYEIMLSKTSYQNYEITNFVSANYIIEPKKLTVEVVSTEKVYGEEDSLEFVLSGNLEELEIVLIRDAGENVGVYNINQVQVSNTNYVVETFIPGTLTINPKLIEVEIETVSKVFGEEDVDFVYNVSGLVNNDSILLNFIREVGENAGEYQISLFNNQLQNYVISGNPTGVFVIKKADVEIYLENVVAVYNGDAVFAREPEFGFELTYEYYAAGMKVEEPVNAGTYQVIAKFAGNENFNAGVSNKATIVIEQKMIPITLKKSTFVFNGMRQSPVFETGIDENVSLLINYTNDVDPIEIGVYKFNISSNDPNYYCDFSGELSIVDEQKKSAYSYH